MFNGELNKGKYIGGLDFSYDDKYLVVSGSSGIDAIAKSVLSVYDMNTLSLEVESENDYIYSASFSDKNNYNIRLGVWYGKGVFKPGIGEFDLKPTQ